MYVIDNLCANKKSAFTSGSLNCKSSPGQSARTLIINMKLTISDMSHRSLCIHSLEMKRPVYPVAII